MKTDKLDRLDLKIIGELHRDGRMTNVALSRRINLSASPCLERVRRLESSGIIKGYNARIDLDRMGPNITVFSSVTLASHRTEDFRRFENAVKDIPEIVECYGMSGDYDYLIKVVCRDTVAFQAMMDRIVASNLGIHTYFPHIALQTIKSESPDFPFAALADCQN